MRFLARTAGARSIGGLTQALSDATLTFASTPDNPVPAGGTMRRVQTSDGLSLRAARWMPRSRAPHGTVAIFPGREEFIEKYFEVIGELLARNFCVAALDWRGQGGSARELAHPRKGHVDDFADYELDLTAFIEEVIAPLCPKPWFALAHSMGAAILATAAHDGELPFERMVLVAPMFKIALVKHYAAARLLAQTLDAAGLGGAFIPGGGPFPLSLRPFEGNPVTSDPVRYSRTAGVLAAAPQLGIGSPTIGWVNSAFRFCARFVDPDFPRRIFTPTLVFACGNDVIVDTPTIERFAVRLKAGSHLLVSHAKHELLMERDVYRAQFWAAFDAFVPGTRQEIERLTRMAAQPEPARRFSWRRRRAHSPVSAPLRG